MRKAIAITVLIVLSIPTCLPAFEKKAFRMREDYGVHSLRDNCTLQYYYFIPCPTYSWFWGFYNWDCGDIIGKFFTVGDTPTGVATACDPVDCHNIAGIEFLDFAGFGTLYPGFFTVQFDIYCANESGAPLLPIWTSSPVETHIGWNVVQIDSPWVMITDCSTLWQPPSAPRFLVTATHIGTECTYPQWAFDNISAHVSLECEMHDLGCLPILYPRPYDSYYPTIHSGYYGIDFAYVPPLWFLDGGDTSQDGTVYGFLELTWKILLECAGPWNQAVEPTTWSGIKNMYR